MIDNSNAHGNLNVRRELKPKYNTPEYLAFIAVFAEVAKTSDYKTGVPKVLEKYNQLSDTEQATVHNSIMSVMPAPLVIVPLMIGDPITPEESWTAWIGYCQKEGKAEFSDEHRNDWFKCFYLLESVGLAERNADGRYYLTDDGMMQAVQAVASRLT